MTDITEDIYPSTFMQESQNKCLFKGGVFRQAYGTIISLCERKIELLNIGEQLC